MRNYTRKLLMILTVSTSVLLAGHASAAWMEEFTGNTFTTSPSTPFGKIDANLSFAVFDNSVGTVTESVPMAGSPTSVDIAAGEYGYFYQMVNAGSTPASVIDFDVSTSGVSLTSIGVIDGSVFADESDGVAGIRALGTTSTSTPNLGLGTDSSGGSILNLGDGSVPTTVAGTTTSPISFSTNGSIARAVFFPFGVEPGDLSSILFFTSASKPTIGNVLVNIPNAPGLVAVPVPTPNAFALIAAVLPFGLLLRRRRPLLSVNAE